MNHRKLERVLNTTAEGTGYDFHVTPESSEWWRVEASFEGALLMASEVPAPKTKTELATIAALLWGEFNQP